MGQIFSPRANTILIIVIVTSVLGGLLFIFSAPLIQSNQYLTQVKIVRKQPVPFSHEHHAGDLGVDCRYCHQSVELSSFAGMPAASVCMHCHSQMWTVAPMLEPVRQAYTTGAPLTWSKVHKLPDYVFFNHGIHVSKGIGCASCHGNVTKMPLMYKEATLQMSWCLNCHRNPERFVRPKSEVFNMNWVAPNDEGRLGNRLVHEYHIEKRTDCYTCHR
jgi:hypothetical protein